MTLRFTSWATLSWALAASAARGEAAPEPFHLVYRAPAGCPSADEFVAEMREAAERVELAPPGEGRRFEVQIAADGKSGRLSLEQASGGMRTRDVQGASCAEVSRLLAFVTGMALDDAADASATSLTAPAAPHDARALELATPAYAESPPSRAVPAPGWPGLEVFGLVQSGAAPRASFGAGLHGWLAFTLPRAEPAMRLGAAYTTSRATEIEGARATFATLFAVLEACPTTLHFGRIALRPCLRSEAGRRVAEAHDVPHARRFARPWFGLGAMAQLRVRLGKRLVASLAGGALLPLVRDRAFLAPDVAVHEVPPVSAVGEIAVGYEWRDQNRNRGH